MALIRLISALCIIYCCQARSAPLFGDYSATNDEYLVVLKTGKFGIASATSLPHHLNVLNSFNINGWRALHVKADGEILSLLQEDTNVDFIEANRFDAHVAASCVEQSTGSDVWGLSRVSSRTTPNYEHSTYQYVDIQDGSGVEVYVLDTGINVEHTDFGGRAEHGFTAPGITEGDDDLNGHGTHCAGSVGGTKYGVAKGVKLIAVKVLGFFGFGSNTDIISGIEYVHQQHTAGSKTVMNLSLGGAGSSPAMEAALQAAIDAGVHAVVAAGNSNADACSFSPAHLADAITVAASNIKDDMYSSSNHGTCVDVIAPGENIPSTYIGGPDATATLTGTSMAAPHVAGWVARHLSSFESNELPSPFEVRETLIREATTADVIQLREKEDTPNLLLFASC